MADRRPFIEHVHELRGRIFKVVFVLLAGTALGYFIRERLLVILVKPLGEPLYFTTPSGGLEFVFRISMFLGIILATPVAVYQLFKFLQPTIDQKSSRFIAILSVASVLLLISGILFGYFVTLPAALTFLKGFSNDQVHSLITTSEYLSFVTVYLAGFAILFQLPIILLFINRITPLTPGGMFGFERWVILVSFVVAAIITPTPDPLNQLFMAMPIIILYNLSIGVIWITNRRHKTVIAPVLASEPVTVYASEPLEAIEPVEEPKALPQPKTLRPALSMDGMRRSQTPIVTPEAQPIKRAPVITKQANSKPLFFDIFPV